MVKTLQSEGTGYADLHNTLIHILSLFPYSWQVPENSMLKNTSFPARNDSSNSQTDAKLFQLSSLLKFSKILYQRKVAPERPEP
jgi:hypothetical protein